MMVFVVAVRRINSRLLLTGVFLFVMYMAVCLKGNVELSVRLGGEKICGKDWEYN